MSLPNRAERRGAFRSQFIDALVLWYGLPRWKARREWQRFVRRAWG